MDLGFTALVFLLTVTASMLFHVLSSSVGPKKKLRLTTAHVLIAFTGIIGALIWGLAYYAGSAVDLAQQYTEKMLPHPKNGHYSLAQPSPTTLDRAQSMQKSTLKSGEVMNRSLQDAASQITR